jgi:hypothetical protein
MHLVIVVGISVVIVLQILLLKELRKDMSTSNTALAALQAQVASNTTIEASAVTLIQGLAAQIAAAGTDPAALAALTASLNTSATALAAAITANTPAAPAPAA